MLDKVTLQSRLNALAPNCFEVETISKDDLCIEMPNLDSLFDFVSKVCIDTVFFCYGYLEAEQLYITDDALERLHLDESDIDLIQNQIDEYNESVNRLNYQRPYWLTVFCVYQSKTVYFEDNDSWFIEEGYDVAEEAARRLVEENLELICQARKIDSEKRMKERERLRERIFKDEKFHKCTNKSLRLAYVRELFNNDPSLEELFSYGQGDISIDVFIDQIWKEYRSISC